MGFACGCFVEDTLSSGLGISVKEGKDIERSVLIIPG